MAKLTLTVDRRIISAARRYAKERGISLSEMVETYLAAVASAAIPAAKDTPILRALRGALKSADLAGYRKHMAAKYR